MVVAVLVIVALVVSAAVLALVREDRRLRLTVERLERRIAALELDGAATLVVEPDVPPPLRRTSQLLN